MAGRGLRFAVSARGGGATALEETCSALGVERLNLPPLPDAEAVELFQAVAAAVAGPRAALALAPRDLPALAGGMPGPIVHLAKEAAASGMAPALTSEGGAAALRPLAAARVDDLRLAPRLVLRACSIFMGDFSRALAATVSPLGGGEALSEALALLRHEYLLLAGDTGPDAYRFASAPLREACLAQLTRAQRLRMHSAAAEHLAQSYKDAADVRAAAAHHFVEAGRPLLAARYAVLAAPGERAGGRPEAVLDLLRRARGLLARCADAGDDAALGADGVDLAAALEERIGVACASLGHHVAAIGHFDAALATAHCTPLSALRDGVLSLAAAAARARWETGRCLRCDDLQRALVRALALGASPGPDQLTRARTAPPPLGGGPEGGRVRSRGRPGGGHRRGAG